MGELDKLLAMFKETAPPLTLNRSAPEPGETEAQTAWRLLEQAHDREIDLAAALDRARAAAVALEQELDVVSRELDFFTHDFARSGIAQDDRTIWCRCGLRVDRPEHHTPRWLRRRHGLG